MSKPVKLNIFFKDQIKSYIINNNLFKKGPNSKHSLDVILDVIYYILQTGNSWRTLNDPCFNNLYKWQTFYTHFNKFCKFDVFKNVYLDLLSLYFKSNKSEKLKYISIDSSIIKNEYASDCNFGYNKKKRCSKLSIIVDSFGIPLSALLVKGSNSDQTILFDNFKDLFVNISYNSNNNKHKRYLLADTGYDSEKIRNMVNNFKIHSIIPANKRNTKNKELLKKKKLSGAHRKIYRKRMIVENCFSWIFKNRRLNRRYDKNITSYLAFLFMGFIKIIIKRIK